MSEWFTFRSVVAALLICASPFAHAELSQIRSQTSSAKSDLDSVSSEIKTATKKLKLTQAERTKQQRALRSAESKISTLSRSIKKTEREAAQAEQRLDSLRVRKVELNAVKSQQLGDLKRDIREAYRTGRNDALKMVLNQEKPAEVTRQLRYLSYIQKARSSRIRELDTTLVELAQLEAEQAEQITRLAELEKKLSSEKIEMEDAKSKRASALKALNIDIAAQDKRLKQLKKDRAALQSLMKRLERQAQEEERKERERRAAANGSKAPADDGKKPVWSQEPDYSVPYRGNCALPTKGGIRAQFGSPRGGGLRWNGIVIDAPAGATATAVKSGKVVYADYLRGYGKLVIVDHGSGFMSLYGYNQSLKVRTGEKVSAGQAVSTVGSGDEGEIGLYFETRVRGRPSQPGNWCSY